MPDPEVPESTGPEATGPEGPEAGTAAPKAGPARLRAALVRPSRAQVVVGLLLAVLGFAAVTQVRANELDNTYASYREQDLIDVLNTMTDATQRAQGELARLERIRRDLRSATRQRAAALAQAQEAVEALNVLAGTVPVTGPGIRITITEEEGPVDVDSLLDTVQELRTAGAEAMEFNNQVRIVAQSAFADATGGIVVDGTLLTSPYVIEVIGDPATLEAAMVFPQGPRDQLEDDGAAVGIEQVSSLTIDRVATPKRPDHAEPDTTQ